MGGLLWDVARWLSYAALVPLVYVAQPGLQTSVALLVGLSIAAPLESATQALLKSWRRWRGATSPKVITTDDRLDHLTERVDALAVALVTRSRRP